MFKQTIVESLISVYQSYYARTNGIPFLSNEAHKNDVASDAHIFGSGASAIETQAILTKNSVVYGCNLTLALLPSWHYGFVERLEDNVFGELQMKILSERKIDKLVLKNTYPFKSNKTKKNIQTLKRRHSVYLLKECQIVSKRDDIEHIVSLLSTNKHDVTRQYASSILTMVFHAVKSGYKNITLHGVDFGGANFYDIKPYVQYRPTVIPSNNARHQTEGYAVTFSEILNRITLLMRNDGVQIRHAKDIV